MLPTVAVMVAVIDDSVDCVGDKVTEASPWLFVIALVDDSAPALVEKVTWIPCIGLLF